MTARAEQLVMESTECGCKSASMTLCLLSIGSRVRVPPGSPVFNGLQPSKTSRACAFAGHSVTEPCNNLASPIPYSCELYSGAYSHALSATYGRSRGCGGGLDGLLLYRESLPNSREVRNVRLYEQDVPEWREVEPK